MNKNKLKYSMVAWCFRPVTLINLLKKYVTPILKHPFAQNHMHYLTVNASHIYDTIKPIYTWRVKAYIVPSAKYKSTLYSHKAIFPD